MGVREAVLSAAWLGLSVVHGGVGAKRGLVRIRALGALLNLGVAEPLVKRLTGTLAVAEVTLRCCRKISAGERWVGEAGRNEGGGAGASSVVSSRVSP